MIELLLTSFPFAIRIAYLRWRGIPVTLYNVHRALFLWLVLAMVVFFTVFYYYPKSYTGIVPFRTVPVVAENGGTVTEVLVRAGQRVAAGDLLFTIEDTTEQAAVLLAEHQLAEAERAIEAARVEARTAEAIVEAAEVQLAQSDLSLSDQLELQERGSAAFQQSQLERVQNLREGRIADLAAARTRLEFAQFRVDAILPAQLDSTEAFLEQARVELAKTKVYAQVDGVVEQLTLNVGARASQVALNPSLVIVPDRMADDPIQVVGGFSQVTRSVLHEGMDAEVACESNFNIAMRNTVLPARIVRIQDAVSAGQLSPTGRLIEPAERAQRGDIVTYLEVIFPEHEALLIEGSGCMIQTYTTHVTGALEGTVWAHGIEALGVLKAILLRVKVWVALAAGIGLGGGGH